MSSPVKLTTKGFGTLSLTANFSPQPFEKSVKVMKYVKEKYGVKIFNCSEFYQFNPKFSNLKLMAQFVEQEKDENLILCIKGATDLKTMEPDGSEESVKRSIENCLSYFQSVSIKPKIIFEASRVDPNVPIEKTVGYIYEFVKKGLIDGVSISEVGVDSIRKSVSVAPISAIEVEFSLFVQDILHNGILAEASKHGIPIFAYSPLGRGILTDSAALNSDFLGSLADNDPRKIMGFERFIPEIFEANKKRLDALYKYAQSKKLSLECLALSYLESISELGDFFGIPKVCTIIPIPSGSTLEKIDRNYSTVRLSRTEIDELQGIVLKYEVIGRRYNESHERFLNG